jgi:hypothetical protein
MNSLSPVLRIRDVYPGSKFFLPGFRVKKISDPRSGSESRNLSIFKPKTVSTTRKNKLGCSSRIPDPGSKGKKNTGSRIRNTNYHKYKYGK